MKRFCAATRGGAIGFGFAALWGACSLNPRTLDEPDSLVLSEPVGDDRGAAAGAGNGDNLTVDTGDPTPEPAPDTEAEPPVDASLDPDLPEVDAGVPAADSGALVDAGEGG